MNASSQMNLNWAMNPESFLKIKIILTHISNSNLDSGIDIWYNIIFKICKFRKINRLGLCPTFFLQVGISRQLKQGPG